jgi:hypothetical protein
LEIGVAIAIVSCAARDCFNPQDFFGDVLYHGGYDPVQVFNTRTTLYQNFTVEIPAGFAKGPAQLNVAHSGLIGVRTLKFAASFETDMSLSGWFHTVHTGAQSNFEC